ncbi:HNH endonuclease signature motif containing protein [Pseudomonas crudilactis]|uniref:HNH endonuclease signature motif containing protein n=1 Tax=Pseudomonas crudilactis TaxID=2697028 RepID=UPI0015DB5784|nr:HNH endonuclease signature motif containing protein [Pseudomonas crudilactis]
MMRLTEPLSFERAIEICITGITGNANFKRKVEGVKINLLAEGERYLEGSRNGALYLLAPVDLSHNPNPIVLNDLTKSDFVKLYETYFVPEEKPTREIYEKLLNSAKESCPFCGGIGTPRNLDHFLPKSHFPQFSILPSNLVPSCRDCNMDGKAAVFATQADHQVIQPYLDQERFFLDQWIFAQYKDGEMGEPGEFEYFVSAPADWPETDKRRAKKHFDDFNLARRYAVKAAQNLGTIMSQVKSLKLHGLTDQVICDTILVSGVSEAQFPNHWQRGLYQALILHFSE